MSIDETQVVAAVAAVVDPELRRPLGELGMVGPVRTRRRRAEVSVALPVAHYPRADELVARVRDAVSAVAGVGEVEVETTVMGEEPRAHLRMLLRGDAVPMGTMHAQDDGHGHSHGHGGGSLGHEEGRPNRFMDPKSLTRVIGISSGKGGVGKSSVTVNLAISLARAGYTALSFDFPGHGANARPLTGSITDVHGATRTLLGALDGVVREARRIGGGRVDLGQG